VSDLLAEYRKPQPVPEKAAEEQLHRFLTQVKFRRSDKAAEFFAREHVDARAREELQQAALRGQKRLEELDAAWRRKGRDFSKLPATERVRLISAKLAPNEVFAVGLV